MTAVKSPDKNSFFPIRFRTTFAENKKVFIVHTILGMLGLPVLAGLLLYSEYTLSPDYPHVAPVFDIEGLFTVSIFAFALSMITGVIMALNSFRYLYTKSLVDMNYSLPLTSRQRFIADYTAGLASYLIPFIAEAIISLIILSIGSVFIDMSWFWEYFGRLFGVGISILIGMIMLYTLTVMTTTFCGAIFEASFAALEVNVIIPVAILCGFFCIEASCPFGITSESILYSGILNSTSPAGIVVFIVTFLEANDSSTLGVVYLRWIIPTLIVLAIYLFIAITAYTRRKAEHVSKPYVYKLFYYVIVTLAVFCILSNLIINETGIVPGLIICGIMYFILEVISKRGFKRFWVSVIRYGVTVGAVFVFCSICQSTEGFGINKYVVPEKLVSSVDITLYGDYGNGNAYPDIYQLNFKDPDVIREMTECHKEMIKLNESYEDLENESASSERHAVSPSPSLPDNLYRFSDPIIMEFTYNLKTGSTVHRDFDFTSDIIGELYTAILLSDEYAEFISNTLHEDLFNYNNDYLYVALEDVEEDDRAAIIIADKLLCSEQAVQLSHDEAKELCKAYKNDMLAMTEEELRNAPIYCYLASGSPLWVKSTFKNTIAFLEEHDILPEHYADESLEYMKGYFPRIGLFTDVEASKTFSYSYYDPDTSWYEHYYKIILNSKFTNGYPIAPYELGAVSTMYFDEDFDKLAKLINSATPIVLGEEPAGALYVDNNHSIDAVLFIPNTEENVELLESLYNGYIKGQAYVGLS